MLAADQVIPSTTTDGIPIPTGKGPTLPVAVTAGDRSSRPTSLAVASTTDSGVDGFGVATRIRSPTSAPIETSTAAALIPLPPMSTPMAIRGPRVGSELGDTDPPIHDELRTVREARLGGGQVDRHVHDLLRLAEPAVRVAGQSK